MARKRVEGFCFAWEKLQEVDIGFKNDDVIRKYVISLFSTLCIFKMLVENDEEHCC
jgi:hypothetical protein